MISYLIMLAIIVIAYFAAKTVLRSAKNGGCVGCDGCGGSCGCGQCGVKNVKK